MTNPVRLATGFVLVVVASLVVLAGGLAAQQPESAPALLRAAIDMETVDGDIRGAIKAYQDIAARYAKSDRATAARALMRMADAHQKLGSADAERIYRQVVRDYPEQKELVSIASTKLLAVRSGTDARRSGPLCTGCVGPYIHSFTLSPDGRWFGYTEANNDLMVRNLETGEVRRLVSFPAESYATLRFRARRAIWSRDGRKVAFRYRDTQAPGSFSDRDYLRVLTVDSGTEPTTLVDNPDFIYVNPAAWSIDGASILVAVERRDLTWQLAWVSAATGEFRVLRSLNWGFDEFRNGPELSPDGRYIAYATYEATIEPPTAGRTVPTIKPASARTIHVLAADGTRDSIVARSESGWPSPVWNADGSAVLFVSDRNSSGVQDLWSVEVRGDRAAGTPTVLKPSVGTFVQLVATTRSGTLYYVTPESQNPRVFIAETSAHDDSNTTGATVGFNGKYPSWSPEGDQLAWWDKTLNVVSAEGGGVKTYSLPQGVVSAAPMWLPDASALLVPMRNRATGRGFMLVRVGVDTSDVRPMGTYAPRNGENWSSDFDVLPNRNAVLLASTTKQGTSRSLVLLDLSNGAAAPLVSELNAVPQLQAASESTVGVASEIVWAPMQSLSAATRREGSIAVVTATDREASLNLFSPDGSSSRLMYGPVALHTWKSSRVLPFGRPKWLAPGLGIALPVQQDDLSWKVMRIADDGHAEPLGSPQPLTLAADTLGFDVSPDGKHVAYERMVTFNGELAALDLRALPKAPPR